MAKAKLNVLRATLSLESISSALRISADESVAKFRDPRVTSWFAEIWGERIFNYTKHLSSNQAGSDAAIALGDIGRYEIGVRCFYKGSIKFQKSKFIGSGRSATVEDLVESLESIETYVVVDLRNFPVLDFYPLDTKALLKLVREGTLKVSGMSLKRFDLWIKETFDVTIKGFEL